MTFAEPTTTSGSSPEVKTAEVKIAEAKVAEALVTRELLEPLAVKESHQGRFSRGRLPPQDRRVRILDDQPRKDSQGDAFVTFAVDARHGMRAEDNESSWRKATITGCAYPGRSQVFIKKGDQYRPAAFLLGKKLKPAAAGTCEPEPAKLADSN
jgi:hypothetical protein